MKNIFIGALLATALATPVLAQSSPTTPLRNDLRADDAGVKNAGPGTEVQVLGEGDLMVVEPDEGNVVTTVPSGSSSTSGTIIVDRTTEQPLPSDAPTTPLRNDLKSNEAGVKGAVQPQKDEALPN